MNTYQLEVQKEMFGKYAGGYRSVGLVYSRRELTGVNADGSPQFAIFSDKMVNIEVRERLECLYVWLEDMDTAFTLPVKWKQDIHLIRKLFDLATSYAHMGQGLFDLLSHIALMQNVSDIPF